MSVPRFLKKFIPRTHVRQFFTKNNIKFPDMTKTYPPKNENFPDMTKLIPLFFVKKFEKIPVHDSVEYGKLN